MAKTWHALPYTRNPRLFAKAPDLKTFQEQEHQLKGYGMTILPKEVDEGAAIAEAIIDAVPSFRELTVGEEFTLYRYPQGLAVRLASGWTFMVPFDTATGTAVEGAASANPKGERRPRGKAAGG